jgi:hypothetical protein
MTLNALNFSPKIGMASRTVKSGAILIKIATLTSGICPMHTNMIIVS